MVKYIFLDTNVFVQCRSFLSINWRELFNDDLDKDIFIVISYTVNQELDELKKRKKRIRRLQSNLRKFKDKEFSDGVFLKFLIFPIKWSSLDSEWSEKLNENDADCRIIAETLKFKEAHMDDEIYFITGDNTPYFIAQELDINSINWLDEEFKNIFERDKSNIKHQNKLTDLIIRFANKERQTKIIFEEELPNLETFIVQEFPDTSFQEEEFSSNHDFSIKQTGSEELKDLIRSIKYKDIDTFKAEIEKYYNQVIEYKKYKVIKLYLSNCGNKPYNNVTIHIHTYLEKNFDIKSKNELEKPEKPQLERRFPLFTKLFTNPVNIPKSYNIKYIPPEKSEMERKDSWDFGYSIKKIQHNLTMSLYPVMIKFPDEFKTKKIFLSCSFVHDEEGNTIDQTLKLDLEEK